MSADVQFLINLIVALCGGFGAYILRGVAGEMKELASAHRALAERMDNLPNLYARRDDVKEAMHRIEDAVLRIESKIDGKVDK